MRLRSGGDFAIMKAEPPESKRIHLKGKGVNAQ